jgi:hypothetical protein
MLLTATVRSVGKKKIRLRENSEVLPTPWTATQGNEMCAHSSIHPVAEKLS